MTDHEDDDVLVRCPECQESVWLPGALAELDFYQCSDCGYIIDLTVRYQQAKPMLVNQ